VTTHVLLVRHGQTAWNQKERIRGRADVPLDETGRWQAQVTAAYIAARWSLRAVYASRLNRAFDTATAIAEAQGLAAQPEDGLMDLDFGDWSGLSLAEAQARDPDLFRAWAETPQQVHFPAGEGLEAVRQRSTEALQHVVERHSGQTVALVAHAVVNRVLLCAVMGLGNASFWSVVQGTCAVNLIEHDERGYRLGLMNDTSHLWRAGAPA